MIKLSIITLNEEKNIGRCIDAIKDISDDILVVDSFSTDQTEQICLEKGVRFIKHKFVGNIEQWKFTTSEAVYDHILCLDADEVPGETLLKSIEEVKKNWTHDGYTFNRLTSYCGKWIRYGGWYPDKKLRIWDRTKGFWGGINPHGEYFMNEGASIKHLKGDLLHYSFTSIQQHIQIVNSYTQSGAKAAFELGKKGSIFKILFSPFFKFIKSYFFQRGFLDGYYGFVIAIISSFATFAKYIKMRELSINQKKAENK